MKMKPLLKIALLALGVLFFCAALAGCGYFYTQYRKITSSPTWQAQKEYDATITALGKLMELPSGQAAVATITDVEKLREVEPFFEKAENGDRLITYSEALKAILYRPATGKIIDVVPLVINNNEAVQNQEQGSGEAPQFGPEELTPLEESTSSANPE